MGNEITTTEQKYLSTISNFVSFDDDELMGNMGGGLVSNRISIRGNRFTMVANDGDTFPAPDPIKLYFIIIGLKKPNSRSLYPKWNPNEKTAPTCMSYDGVTPDVAQPYNPTCFGCGMKAWNSSTNEQTGAHRPACREHKDVVIKVLGVDGLWLLQIPPGSVSSRKNPKNWDVMMANGKATIAKSNGKLSWADIIISSEFTEDNGILHFDFAGYYKGEKFAQDIEQTATLLSDPGVRDELNMMLWGPQGEARKAQYEEGKGKPTSWVVTGLGPTTVVTTPPLAMPEFVQTPFEETVEAPILEKPVEVVHADPPRVTRRNAAATTPKSKVNDILASMRL